MTISVLDENDLKRLCALIPGKEYKSYFKKTSKEFVKIKPGFRPNGLTDAETIKLATTYANKPYISDFVNFITDQWLNEISIALSDNEAKYGDHDEALAQTLVDSYFVADIDLYFKLTEFIAKDEVVEKTSNRIREIQKEREEIAKNSLMNTGNTDSNELVEKIEKLTKENSQLKSELDNSNAEIEELNKRIDKAEFEINHFREMQSYVDAEDVIHIPDSEFEHLSVCEVLEPDYLEQQYILRLFDINNDGSLTVFNPNPDEPLFFSNRSRLFYKDGPTDVGSIGVWEWTAIPNNKDSSKDYVKSLFNPSLSPVEVISFSDCEILEDVIKRLKDGIAIDIKTKRVMFTTRLGVSPYRGIACNQKQLKSYQGITKLGDDVISLPVYMFSAACILRAANDRRYYSSIDLGAPYDVIHVKNQLDIVKDIISNRCSWNAFKQIGKSRSEWKIARDFLSQVDTKSIVDEIAKSCNCSSVEANELYEEFLGRVDVYIDGESLDDKLLLAVISKNEELLTRCKTLVEEDWLEENREIVDTKTKEAEALEAEVSKAKKELKEHSQKLAVIKADIEKQESLSQGVKEAVEKQIRDAQENAAVFIAKMAFTNPRIIEHAESLSDANAVNVYSPAVDIENSDFDINTDWNNVIDTVSYELMEAGVIEYYARPLAAFLHSARINSIPLLITGPNAAAIADAYSIGAYGQFAGIFDCNKECTSKAIDSLCEIKDPIVKVLNPLRSDWINCIESFANSSSFYPFMIYPYSEDLQIEPKSIYSYVIPLHTDLLVDKKPGNNHMGGKASDDYVEFHSEKPCARHQALYALKIPPLAENNISRLTHDMLQMLGEKTDDYSMLFAWLPYAHATCQMERITSLITGDSIAKINLSENVKGQISSWYGLANE